MKTIFIDATNAILGRLCSFAAKQSLLGKNIIIVNCNDSLISGRRKYIIQDYKRKRALGGAALKGPNYPTIPERIVKRTVRGMLKYKRGRGNEALKRIICYNSIPKEFENESMIKAGKEKPSKTIKLSEVAKEIHG